MIQAHAPLASKREEGNRSLESMSEMGGARIVEDGALNKVLGGFGNITIIHIKSNLFQKKRERKEKSIVS